MDSECARVGATRPTGRPAGAPLGDTQTLIHASVVVLRGGPASYTTTRQLLARALRSSPPSLDVSIDRAQLTSIQVVSTLSGSCQVVANHQRSIRRNELECANSHKHKLVRVLLTTYAARHH